MANGSPRADYDAIAPLYDSGPGRAKAVDPELLAYLGNRAFSGAPCLLDVACGTGNQLIANRAAVPYARMVGVDRSSGMLRQAWRKSQDIRWVQADATALPFPAVSFDFISCQFALHHFMDKTGMLRETFRVLRADGRFAIRNLCPQESTDWLYYQYFPEAQIADLRDFWPPAAVVAMMEEIGFATVSVDYQHLHFQQDLRVWIETVRRRDTCSQLLAITDTAYEAGLHRLELDLKQKTAPQQRADHLCVMTIRSDKPCS